MLRKLYGAIGGALEEHGMPDPATNMLELVGSKFQIDADLASINEADSIFRLHLVNQLQYPLVQKMAQEKFHYEKLMGSLAHSIGENYFYKRTRLDACRQYVALSTDCISSIQVLVRQRNLHLNVFFRSSHYDRLLPADLLFLWSVPSKFLDAARHIDTTFNCGWEEMIERVSGVYMSLMFGSLHKEF